AVTGLGTALPPAPPPGSLPDGHGGLEPYRGREAGPMAPGPGSPVVPDRGESPVSGLRGSGGSGCAGRRFGVVSGRRGRWSRRVWPGAGCGAGGGGGGGRWV